MVKSALALPSSNISNDWGQSSSSLTEHPEAVQTNLDILHLASALFFVENQAGFYAYPDMFFIATCDHNSPSPVRGEDVQCPGSLQKRFSITFLKEASHIVCKCSLDPRVATVANMDDLIAQLGCMSCEPQVL